MANPVIHWAFSAPNWVFSPKKKTTSTTSFCNRQTSSFTKDKLKVTCGSCIRLMKLHDHYVCDECGQRLDCINSPYGVGGVDDYNE